MKYIPHMIDRPNSKLQKLPNQLNHIELWDSKIDIDASVRDLDSEFRKFPNLPGLIILENLKIVGIVSRVRFAYALSRQFAREIFMKGPIRVLFDFDIVDTNPLILDGQTLISSAVQSALARPAILSYEPAIVVDQSIPKVLDIDLLMRLQSDLLQDALMRHQDLIEDERKTAQQLRQTMTHLELTRDRLLRSEESLEAQVLERTLELKKTNEDLIKQQKQINEDLEFARTLQLSILPTTFPQHEHYQAYGFMRAARMIGGDFYDAYQINDHQFGFVVGDVSGKGVPAALFMVLVKTILQEQAINHVSPAVVISRLNSQILLRNPLSLFVTLLYGVLDTQTGVFTFCNAGHSMPYIIRGNKKIETISNKSCPLVGLLDHPKYNNISISLDKNDRIFLMTDGVTEFFNSKSEAYGEKRLLNVLSTIDQNSKLEEVIQKLVMDLDLFSNGTPASDDVTALMFHYENEVSIDPQSIPNLGVLKELVA